MKNKIMFENEDFASDFLETLCDGAINYKIKQDIEYLEKLFEENIDTIQKNFLRMILSTGGRTFHIWWMDGVHKLQKDKGY